MSWLNCIGIAFLLVTGILAILLFVIVTAKACAYIDDRSNILVAIPAFLISMIVITGTIVWVITLFK